MKTKDSKVKTILIQKNKKPSSSYGIVRVPVEREISNGFVHTGADLALIEKQTTTQPVISTPGVGLIGYSEDIKEVIRLHPMQAALLIYGLTKNQQFDVHNSKVILALIGVGIYALADIGAIRILRRGRTIEDNIFNKARELETFDLFGFHDVKLGMVSFGKSKSSRLSITTRHCKRGIKHLTRLKAEYGLYKRIRRYEKRICGDDPEKALESGKPGTEGGVDFHILITMLTGRLHLKESSRNHYRKVAKVTALSLSPLGLMNKFTPSGAKTCFVISRLGALVRQTLINDIIRMKGLRPIVAYPPLPFYIYVPGSDLMAVGAVVAFDGKAISSICFDHPRSKLLTAGLIEPFLDPSIFKSALTDVTSDTIDTDRGQAIGFYCSTPITVRQIILLGSIVGPVAVMRARLGIQWWRYVLTPPMGIFKRQMALFKNKSAVDKL